MEALIILCAQVCFVLLSAMVATAMIAVIIMIAKFVFDELNSY
jgi:hypothetical protein